jgi:hypothetical protein
MLEILRERDTRSLDGTHLLMDLELRMQSAAPMQPLLEIQRYMPSG